jgi:hypothetical protein
MLVRLVVASTAGLLAIVVSPLTAEPGLASTFVPFGRETYVRATGTPVIGMHNDPPVITVATRPPANTPGWNTTSVAVSFTCEDASSGVATCAAPMTVTAEGACGPRDMRARAHSFRYCKWHVP